MERVLIVAKTHVLEKVCTGALNLRTNRNIRLLLPGGHHHSPDTPFDIGQVWDLGLRAVPSPTPPHIEDMIIGTHSYLQASYPSIQELLLQHVQPWKADSLRYSMAASRAMVTSVILRAHMACHRAAQATG